MGNKKNTEVVDFLDEKWVDIFGFVGLYAISNMGRVKSLERKDSNNRNKINEKILKLSKSKLGYSKGTLCKNGKLHYFLLHRLIAISFIENPLKLPCINHIDNNPNNNNLKNLEWCTYSQNTRHAIKNKRLSWVGIKNGSAKLNEEQVLQIFNSKEKSKALSEKNNISRETICNIKNGRVWCEITGKRHKSISRIIERIN